MNRHINVNLQNAEASYYVYSHPTTSLSRSFINDNYEIIFIVSGKGIITIEGTEYKLSRGSLFLINPLVYYMFNISLDTPYEYYSLKFSKSSVLSEAMDQFDAVCSDGLSKRYLFYSNSDGVFSMFERIENLARMPENGKILYFKMLLSEILLTLNLSSLDDFCDFSRDLGSRVIRYLSDNIDRSISLDSLARRFFVSKYYLCRAFKKRNGISVRSYINRKRVMYAKQLIENGESASSASYKVGFGDYSAFYRAYVKYIGSSPITAYNADDALEKDVK